MIGSAAAGSPALLDLVEPERWQRLQDHFASVLGIAIRTVSPSRELLVTPSWPAGLSADQVVRILKIGEELESLLPVKDPPQGTTTLTTTLGVMYAAVPIRATSEQAIAYFVTGPMMVGAREDELQFRQRVSAKGLNAPELWAILLSLKLYTFAGIRSMLNLMEEVGTALTQLAYQARELRAILPSTSKVDQAVVAYYTDRVLHSLLEAATLATRADGGSVMLYDRRNDALEIKVAQGLSDEIVASTRLKRGEGIAGLAVAERAVLLVDRDTLDPRIKNRMARGELSSSLVAPLMPDMAQEPIGVLNLRTAQPDHRFTKDHVELLWRLLDLAGVALKSLRLALQPQPSGTNSH